MSLVGSEVDVSIDVESQHHTYVSDDELSVPGGVTQNDLHPPPSPPRGIERLFLNDLETQSISASALAQQIHLSHRQSTSGGGWGGLSVNTDDFATASGWVTAADESDSLFGDSMATPRLVSSRSDTLTPHAESDNDDDSDYYEQNKFFPRDVLSRIISSPKADVEVYQDSTMATPTAAPVATKFFPTEPPQHVDAAEKVYDTAKGVWAWGKGISIVTPFLGIAEQVAGKVVGMAGSSLEGLDSAVTEQLHGLDDKVLNPAIAAILGAVFNAAGKTEDTLKPVLMAILKPLGLIKESAENPEVTPVPGVTVQ